MQEHQDEIVRLLFKLVKGEQLYSDEQLLLDNWIAESSYNKHVFDEVTNEQLLEEEVNGLVGYDQKFLWRQIHRGIHGQPRESRLLYFFKTLTGRVAVVVVLLALALGIIYIVCRSSSPSGELTSVRPNPYINTGTEPAKEDIIQELAGAAAIALSNATNDKMISEDVSFYNTPSTDLLSPSFYNKQRATREAQYGNSFGLTGGLVACLDPFSSKRPGLNGIESGIVFADESYCEVPMDATRSFIVTAAEKEQGAPETGLPDVELNPNLYTDEAGKRWVPMQSNTARKRNNKINVLPRSVKVDSDQKVGNSIDTDNIMHAKDQALYPL